MQYKATRIHIIGSPGSGKTTLAKQLSRYVNVPCHHLDGVAYEGGFGRRIPLDARLASLRQIIVQPAWVTEGAFLWWTESLMEAADLIIWLDMPFYINGWRIVTRHVKLSWAGTNRHPGTVKLIRFLFHVMGNQIRHRAITPQAPDDDDAATRLATVEFLANYSDKVVHCRYPGDVTRFKAQFLKQQA